MVFTGLNPESYQRSRIQRQREEGRFQGEVRQSVAAHQDTGRRTVEGIKEVSCVGLLSSAKMRICLFFYCSLPALQCAILRKHSQ